MDDQSDDNLRSSSRLSIHYSAGFAVAAMCWIGFGSTNTDTDQAEQRSKTAPPNVLLQGRIEIEGTGLRVDNLERQPWIPEVAGELPRMKFEVVSDGDHVIPHPRSYQISSHDVFDFFVSPGTAYALDGENFAQLPFTLVHRWVNCAHNGVLSFQYTESRAYSGRVSISQETCHFVKFDMDGDVDVTYFAYEVENQGMIARNYLDELALRLPQRPIAVFEEKYDVNFDDFLLGLPENDDLTVAGIYFEGVHYTYPCRTRSLEPYPFCDHMLLTSFSTAKSTFPALALMRLAETDGPEIYTEKVATYVSETASSPGKWDDVTFDHLGDMTSGNFANDSPLADATPGNFYGDTNAATKLNHALSWPHGAPAGSRFVYQTADTFILVVALDRYLQKHHADYTDSFDYVVDQIYKPITLSPEVLSTRRTQENGVVNAGTAYGGFGMWWDRDSIVKLSKFLLIDQGKIEGNQILHSDAVSAALFLSNSDKGINMRMGGQRYNNGMWAIPAHRLVPQLSDCESWVPNMSGLSGVKVLLMPNGMIFYYFNDAQRFPTGPAIVAANKIESFCDNSE